MTYDDIITKYGSAAQAARKLGTTRATLSNWKRYGIPPGRQAQLQIMFRGRLKADPPK